MSTRKKTKRRPRGGASHPCPRCRGNTHVVITRRSDQSVMRKRHCLKCGHEFKTVEEATG